MKSLAKGLVLPVFNPVKLARAVPSLLKYLRDWRAYARLKDCVSRPEKGQQLKFGEIVAAMNFNGRFDPLYHACNETAHERPMRRAPQDQAAELQSRIERNVDEMKRLVASYERLARPPLAGVAGGKSA